MTFLLYLAGQRLAQVPQRVAHVSLLVSLGVIAVSAGQGHGTFRQEGMLPVGVTTFATGGIGRESCPS